MSVFRLSSSYIFVLNIIVVTTVLLSWSYVSHLQWVSADGRYGSVQPASPFSFVVDPRIPKEAHIKLAGKSAFEMAQLAPIVTNAAQDIPPQKKRGGRTIGFSLTVDLDGAVTFVQLFWFYQNVGS